jgi:hypothetical protein
MGWFKTKNHLTLPGTVPLRLSPDFGQLSVLHVYDILPHVQYSVQE